ncbi:MAG: tetratricopeptide repeat protein [Rhodocyclaceae bacterium]|nr:tetratricopeptide repeat protein [Rhodocyclaceae bacterium]
MSLLMDALKKAEEAKRQAAGEGSPSVAPPAAEAPADLELAPLEGERPRPQGAGGRATLPELPDRLEDLDRQFERPAPPRRRTAPESAKPSRETEAEAREAAEMAAARQVFEAKQPAGDRRAFGVFIGVLVLVGAAVAGGWIWWQTRPSGTQPMAPLAAAPRTADAPARPLAPPPAPPAQSPQSPASQAATPAPDAGQGATTPPAVPARTPARPAEPRAPEAAPAPPSPIRITASRLRVHPGVAAGFDAFSAGRLEQARVEYERVLASEPRNTDALVGLAGIALRQGRPAEAEDLYVRAAEADPRDAAAVAGLVGLRAQADPLQAETRLKTLIAGQPEDAALHFALGNLQSRQARWSDAQQSYFKAHTLEADNPDVVYNLAVALDHLHQAGLAARYYNQALAMTESRPAAFDRASVAARLRELQAR